MLASLVMFAHLAVEYTIDMKTLWSLDIVGHDDIKKLGYVPSSPVPNETRTMLSTSGVVFSIEPSQLWANNWFSLWLADSFVQVDFFEHNQQST